MAGLTNKDSTQVNISVAWPAEMTLPEDTFEAAIPISTWAALTNSSFYNAYSQMYDQVKIDYVRVKINGAILRVITKALPNDQGFEIALPYDLTSEGVASIPFCPI